MMALEHPVCKPGEFSIKCPALLLSPLYKQEAGQRMSDQLSQDPNPRVLETL